MREDMVKEFERRVNETCAARKVPGVVCMAADDSGVIYQKAFGVRDIATDIPMNLNSVFFIASMTKSVVSVAAMKLVEEGKMDLNGDVGDIIPDFKNPLVIEGWDENGVPKLRPAKRPVTLRHLMSQTSGVAHEGWEPNRLRWMQRFGIGSLGKEARRMPLSFDPGERWAYGIGMDWVFECIEKVTGLPGKQYLKEAIFDPLGMKSTGYDLTPGMDARLTAMHYRLEDDSLQSMTVEDFETFAYGKTYDYGNGEGQSGLFSTAPDYLKFLQMLLHDGTFNGVQILKPETVNLMNANQTGDVNMRFGNSIIPRVFAVDDLQFFPGIDTKWGLGFMLNSKETAEGRGPWGMSWFGGFDTYMWVDRANRLCGVVMTQSYPGASPSVTNIVKDFERMLHDRLVM